MVQMLTRLPDELKKDLQMRARQMGLTLNGLILHILWDWVDGQRDSNVNRHLDEGQDSGKI